MAASGQGIVGPGASSNGATIDLLAHGFNPAGTDPHIIVSQRDYNYVADEGNTMDASYCGFTKVSKLVLQLSVGPRRIVRQVQCNRVLTGW